jgi:hypothetical protein
LPLLTLPPDLRGEYWLPITDAQYTACWSLASMLMFGGAAGPGKTSFIVADAVREYDNPNLRGLVLRESGPQLEKSVMPKMRDIYSQMGAYFVAGVKRYWTFPSGAKIFVGVIAKPADVANFQGGEYSYIGIDESTYHPENHLRDLLPWWRTTDPSLFKRIRLATNPGGDGAPWHMHTFLRGRCPYHFPKESVEPGVLYKGSTWLSDGKLIPFTVSFIPGLHTDHAMHGDDYAELLRSQSGDRAEQLLKGCWCSLQGAYFKGMRPDMVIPFYDVHERWWWSHYIGIDYGYGNSAAAAGLYCVSPPTPGFPGGRHFKIDELVCREMLSSDFARAVCARFAVSIGGTPRRIQCGFIDPANNQHTGTGRSNMQIMAEEFDKYDIPLVPASNDPLGGSQNLARMLASGELTLTDLVPHTYKALSTRMHDPKRPGCYTKVRGAAEDDVADETRYATNTWCEQSIEPRHVRIQEQLEDMRKAGLDDHSLMIHSWRLEHDTPHEDAPIIMGRRHSSLVIKR